MINLYLSLVVAFILRYYLGQPKSLDVQLWYPKRHFLDRKLLWCILMFGNLRQKDLGSGSLIDESCRFLFDFFNLLIGFFHESVAFLLVCSGGAFKLKFDLLAHKLQNLKLIQLAPCVFVAVARNREETLEVLLAKRHRTMLGVTRGKAVLLRKVLVVEAHERDVVGADVEKHEFLVEEGVFGELVWEVEN